MRFFQVRAKEIKKANKSERWMPRLWEAMKDVISCDKLGGDFRMGQPSIVKLCYLAIGERQTRGTETSNYP